MAQRGDKTPTQRPSRASKRLRASQDQPSSLDVMGLGGKQLRNVALKDPIVTLVHSDVDSSLQVERTGSSEAVNKTRKETAIRKQAHLAPRHIQELSEQEEPAAKRRRIGRVGLPIPLDRSELQVQDRSSGPLHPDNQDGHLSFQIGENFTARFKIMRKVGEGTFGRVLECWDRVRREYVAIKVIRNVQKYRDAAMNELKVLATLAGNDPTGENHCVKMLEWFDYRGHVCMVFERLGPSLYDCLRKNEYRPFPLLMVQSFFKQLLQAVAYMHELTLIHTDLKPENILLTSQDLIKDSPPVGFKTGRRLPSSTDIKVIDFGSAIFESDRHSSIVSTRHYRAPEIILGLGWTNSCDLWSLGCILVELITGEALYQTHENAEHLAMMTQTLGPIPPSMASICTNEIYDYFDKDSNFTLLWSQLAKGDKRKLRAVGRLKPIPEHLERWVDPDVLSHVNVIADLVTKLMTYEPQKRLTAEQALIHPFFDITIDS